MSQASEPCRYLLQVPSLRSGRVYVHILCGLMGMSCCVKRDPTRRNSSPSFPTLPKKNTAQNPSKKVRLDGLKQNIPLIVGLGYPPRRAPEVNLFGRVPPVWGRGKTMEPPPATNMEVPYPVFRSHPMLLPYESRATETRITAGAWPKLSFHAFFFVVLFFVVVLFACACPCVSSRLQTICNRI